MGKTLTHLVGSYLGLTELWGKGRCQDDRVADTPVHNAPNHRCPGKGHLTFCEKGAYEMTMNFMDNTYDQCMYMFTNGQALRMQAVLSPDRPRSLLAQF